MIALTSEIGVEIWQNLYFYNPLMQEKIWGGQRLKTEFGYEIPDSTTGEYWAISAHPNGVSTQTASTRGKPWTNFMQSIGICLAIAKVLFPLLTKILMRMTGLVFRFTLMMPMAWSMRESWERPSVGACDCC